ncbi:MAG TPA: AAA family ATPase [Actinomycetota bacterium]|nr:AAA family ATPase [Actinomycetota bacterium]
MNRTRRYWRWLKRALIIYAVYIVVGTLLLDASPAELTFSPGATFGEYRQMIVQLLFAMSFLVVQFVALFWFLARGTYYVVYPNEYDHTFSDVRGQPAAVRSTKEVLRLFMGFKNFKQMGGYPPHGILFEGPPGTGKTLMAKAIAGQAQVPILVADGSRFMSMFFGIGNIKVRRMFTRARAMSDKYGGAVIFIDELDALGASRGAVSQRMTPAPQDSPAHKIVMGAGMGGAGMGIVNELLVGLDGFVQPKGLWRHVKRMLRLGKPKVPFYNILIIGATNRAATLDPALLRPGRFDRKIHVGLPDHEGREDIAKYYLAKVRHEPIDTAKLARMSKGYSPAMIKNIVNEALIFALQDGRDALRWDDLWQAKLVEEIGLKQPVKYTPREKEMVAVHEAGHAVASYTLEKGELQIQVITIQKREGALGLVHGQEVEEMYTRTQKQILARIQVSLAGLAAEDVWFGQTTTGPSSDLQNATQLAAAYVGLFGMGKSLISVGAMQPTPMDGDPIRAVLSDPDRKKEIEELLATCRRQVTVLLREKRHVVEGIRDALLDREELIGDEIEELMAELGEREPLSVAVTGNGPVAAEAEVVEEPAPRKRRAAGRSGDGRGNGRGSGRGTSRRRGRGNEPPDGPPGGATPPQPPNTEG